MGAAMCFPDQASVVDPSRWRSPPCLTIRGLTRDEHRRLSVIAAEEGVSREDLVRRELRKVIEASDATALAAGGT